VTPALRRVAAACLLGALPWIGPATAQPRQIQAGGLQLRYDETIWRAEPGIAPVLLTLACIAALCGRNAAVTVVADSRPFPQPGAGPFTPGAVSALLVDLRAQNLTPGARLRAQGSVEPFARGGVTGYRSRYVVEDRELRATSLVNLMIRHRGAALHLRLTSPTDLPALAGAFEALATGLSFEN
jgi:hypothetical protein